jgi:hypothetical protein
MGMAEGDVEDPAGVAPLNGLDGSLRAGRKEVLLVQFNGSGKAQREAPTVMKEASRFERLTF